MISNFLSKAYTAAQTATDDYPIITSAVATGVAAIGAVIEEYKPIIGGITMVIGMMTAAVVFLRQVVLLMTDGKNWWSQSKMNPNKKEKDDDNS